MSTQIETHRVVQFAQTVSFLAQQKISQLRNACRMIPFQAGKRVSVDFIGSVTAQKKTVRHQPTTQTDTPHTRRWIAVSDFTHTDYVDQEDKLKVINDPTSDYAREFSMAFGRAIDDEIISAAVGTSIKGEEGTETQTLPAAQTTGTLDGNGLTLGKIITANQLLRAAEFDPMEGFYFVCSQTQVADLLNDTTITSADYNSVKLLMAGEINQFMGFTWIMSERLLTDANGDRRCLAFCKSAIGLTVAKEPAARIGERADLEYLTQVFMSMSLGVSRIQDNGVVDVVCDE